MRCNSLLDLLDDSTVLFYSIITKYSYVSFKQYLFCLQLFVFLEDNVYLIIIFLTFLFSIIEIYLEFKVFIKYKNLLKY